MNIAFLALKATLILAVAFAVTASLRRASAAVRHAIWTTAFGCLLLLPLVSLTAPQWRILPADTNVVVAFARVQSEVPPAHVYTREPARAARPFPWTGLWLLGAAAGLIRLSFSWIRAQRIVMRSRPFTTLKNHEVDVRESSEIPVPVTVGVLRPMVLLPLSASSWDARRLDVVLAHERAHVQRYDCLTKLVTEIVCALYWFHPFAWIAAAKQRKECERACDDAVVTAGTRCSEYAEHLLGIAQSFRSEGGSEVMGLPFFRHNDLQGRLRELLKPHVNRRALPAQYAAVACILALLVVAPIASINAQAQRDSGNLVGSVLDASGAAVPNAEIVLTGLDTKNKEAARANMAGEFSLRGLPPGRYVIEVRSPGFRLFQREIVVNAGGTTPFSPQLDLGAVNERVEVIADRPASAAQPRTANPHRIRVGGNVQATKLVYHVNPVYPEPARMRGVEGAVILQAVIGTDGSLMGTEVLSKSVDSELVQAALDAVRQWRYEPTLLNGVPVEVITSITVNFRLK